MIESIEGKRGMPRLRPPYVAQVGLFGRPTLEHNMETLFLGARHRREGRRMVRAARTQRPQGVALVLGVGSSEEDGRASSRLRASPCGELIDEYCGGMQDGHTFYGVSARRRVGWHPAGVDAATFPLDFDTLQPHGCFIGSAAVIVLSQHDRARDAALNLMQFFADESCGQCTPCRVGTEKAAGLLAQKTWDKPLLDDLSQAMIDASICGLGQAAPNPVACVFKYFPHELSEEHR